MTKSIKQQYKEIALAAIFGLAMGGSAGLGSLVGNTDERLNEQYPSLSKEDTAKLRNDRAKATSSTVGIIAFGIAFGFGFRERDKKQRPSDYTPS